MQKIGGSVSADFLRGSGRALHMQLLTSLEVFERMEAQQWEQ